MTTTKPRPAWPGLSTLLWLFLGFRLPLLLLERPGGYLLEYPAIGTLGSGVAIGWRDWLTLGSMPLQPFVLDRLSGWFTTELSRQLAIGGISLLFEVAVLVLVYALASRQWSEQRARRSALFWALLWFPVWTWLTGLEGSGVALTLATLALLVRRQWLLAGLVGLATLVWMPIAVLLVAPAVVVATIEIRRNSTLDPTVGWRIGGVLLALLLLARPQVPDPLLLLLPAIALLLPSTRGALIAVLLTLLFVLHEPFVPRLLSVESSVLPLLYAGLAVVTIGLVIELVRPLLRRRPSVARLLRFGWQIGVGLGLLALVAAVPLTVSEYRAMAVAQSPFGTLVSEFAATPDAGYVLTGSNELYELIYPLAWRRHTVRMVSERNRDELTTTLRNRPGPVWLIAHPDTETTQQMQQTLRADGYLAGGDWFGDIRLERLLVRTEPLPGQTETPVTFADAGELTRAAWQPAVSAGAWLPIELEWTIAPGSLPSAVFVHLLDQDGERVAQHDSQPTWDEETVITRHALRVPGDVPAGTYTLLAGRYLPDTDERILLVSGDDGIMMGEVTVTDN